jgi:hypothetical protein
MGRPTLTAKARGRSGCRGPFPGGDEASVVACFPSRGCAAWRGEPGNGALELVESRSTPKGVTIQIYRPTGRPQYETATPDLNT